jgi:two-component system, NarL family, invasion response regulator UvrY
MVGVLVADDHAPFRRAVRAVVSATSGFELLAEAASGEEAVAMARSLEPDLVLMDINMPGIGGIAASRRISAVCTTTVVVLTSTYARDDLPREARSCGAAAYVPKQNVGRDTLEGVWNAAVLSAAARRGTAIPP